ncbi:MAG: hypothetical protein AAF799_10975 [Myxococcota bacterium]
MQQPYYDMYMCLMENDWQYWGQWKYNVKAKLNEAIYIGTNLDHITILAHTRGYHRTVGRRTGRQVTAIMRVPELCYEVNRAGFSREITEALAWFHDHITYEHP